MHWGLYSPWKIHVTTIGLILLSEHCNLFCGHMFYTVWHDPRNVMQTRHSARLRTRWSQCVAPQGKSSSSEKRRQQNNGGSHRITFWRGWRRTSNQSDVWRKNNDRYAEYVLHISKTTGSFSPYCSSCVCFSSYFYFVEPWSRTPRNSFNLCKPPAKRQALDMSRTFLVVPPICKKYLDEDTTISSRENIVYKYCKGNKVSSVLETRIDYFLFFYDKPTFREWILRRSPSEMMTLALNPAP